MKDLKRVLVFGGTHGNEWTGVKVVERFSETLRNQFPGLDLHFVLANPEAHALNKRFKDEDLNRAFQYLNESRSTYEHRRAKELKALVDEAPCFIIDLHTTTSNMGKTVIVSDYNPLNFKVSAHLTEKFSDCRIIGSPDPNKKYLASQSPYGLIVEVGPVANGIVEPVVLESTIELLQTILQALSTPNSLTAPSVELYEEIEDVYYPLDDEGQSRGYIHASFQGSDFKALNGTYSPFKTFEGETLKANTKEEVYPIFINEAAYYPQHLAYTLCRKRVVKI